MAGTGVNVYNGRDWVTIECVPLIENVFSYCRLMAHEWQGLGSTFTMAGTGLLYGMCSSNIECVLLLFGTRMAGTGVNVYNLL